MKKVRVGLFFGGESPEHEISIRSAATVVNLLDFHKYQIFPIGITKQGKWKISKQTYLKSNEHSEMQLNQILKSGVNFTEWVILKQKVDIAFPCLHGTYGEDGTIQGIFEFLHLPYVGCGVLSSSLGMDKSLQKRIFNQQGIPVLESCNFENWMWKEFPKNILEEIQKKLHYPLFVKPCRSGSSIGVSKVKSEKYLTQAIQTAFQYDTKVIVEKGIDKAREFEVSVMGNHLPEVSCVAETIPSNSFFDYEAKYLKPSEKKVPAEIPEEISKKIRLMAGMAYFALDCKGFARVDFLATPDLTELYIGEINTIPGLTQTSLFLKLWGVNGKSPAAVLEHLIELGMEHHQRSKS
jgi:D-alanine-D-alanine ligase